MAPGHTLKEFGQQHHTLHLALIIGIGVVRFDAVRAPSRSRRRGGRSYAVPLAVRSVARFAADDDAALVESELRQADVPQQRVWEAPPNELSRTGTQQGSG